MNHQRERTALFLRRITCAAAVIGLSACATSGSQRLASLGVAELTDNVQVARMTVGSHYFEPSRMMVQVGVPVRLILDNETLLAGHAFSIFAPDADLELNAYVPARQQVTVQFLPEQVGEYRFYCNIDDHADQGQVGILVVVEELSPGDR